VIRVAFLVLLTMVLLSQGCVHIKPDLCLALCVQRCEVQP
jgi:hypothetical protein